MAAAVLWASNGVISKHLMNSGLSPFALAQLRLSLAAALAVAWLAATDSRALLIRKGDILGLALVGGMLAAVNGCYLSAISRIPTAAAILLEYAAPAFTAFYAWRFMDERIGPAKAIATALALVGCYLVAGGHDLDLLSLNRWGLLWGLGAALSFSLYGICSEYSLRRYSPWTVLCYALIVSAAVWNLIGGLGVLTAVSHGGRFWLLVLYSAGAGTVIPFGLFAYGIERLRATRATILATFEPIAAGLIAFAWLGETLEGFQILGGLVVLSAVILIQRQRQQDRLTPALLKQGKEAAR